MAFSLILTLGGYDFRGRESRGRERETSIDQLPPIPFQTWDQVRNIAICPDWE